MSASRVIDEHRNENSHNNFAFTSCLLFLNYVYTSPRTNSTWRLMTMATKAKKSAKKKGTKKKAAKKK